MPKFAQLITIVVSLLLVTASNASSDDTFCVDKSGKLSIRAQCKKGERVLQGGLQGPAGPKGDTGTNGADGADGVAGYEVVPAFSSLDATLTKSATSYCSTGKRVIGGGGHGISSDGTTITSSFPQNALDGTVGGAWTVYARYEPAADGVVWRLTAYAICTSIQ